MSENTIHIPNFYEFLASENVNQSILTEADYSDLRNKYARHRNKLYKKRQRLLQKELIIHLTQDEYRLLSDKAKEHKLQIGIYLKHSSLCYSNNSYLVPDNKTLKELLISIQKIEQKISKLADSKSTSIFGNSNKYNTLLELLKTLEMTILKEISQPVNLWEWVKAEFGKNKNFRKEIITLILESQ